MKAERNIINLEAETQRFPVRVDVASHFCYFVNRISLEYGKIWKVQKMFNVPANLLENKCVLSEQKVNDCGFVGFWSTIESLWQLR